jgi:hypothetical protein
MRRGPGPRTPDEVHHGTSTRATSVPLRAVLDARPIDGDRHLPVLRLRAVALNSRPLESPVRPPPDRASDPRRVSLDAQGVTLSDRLLHRTAPHRRGAISIARYRRRYLAQVAAFNLGVILRKLVGAGTPRGLSALVSALRALWECLVAVRTPWDARDDARAVEGLTASCAA